MSCARAHLLLVDALKMRKKKKIVLKITTTPSFAPPNTHSHSHSQRSLSLQSLQSLQSLSLLCSDPASLQSYSPTLHTSKVCCAVCVCCLSSDRDSVTPTNTLAHTATPQLSPLPLHCSGKCASASASAFAFALACFAECVIVSRQSGVFFTCRGLESWGSSL